jgi:hypothetical protein
MKSSLPVLVLLLAGCAGSTYAIPKSHIDAAYGSLGAAERFGVAETQGRLDQANRELAQANDLLARGHTRQADLMYLRADTDARIVVAQAARIRATAETRRLRGQAQRVQSQVSDLCGPTATRTP